MNWVNLDNLKKFYTKLKEKMYLKTEVDTKVDTKANKSDVLTLEEIQASTDLTGKIASASSIKNLITVTDFTATTDSNGRVENYIGTDIINAICISPDYGAVTYIASFNNDPGLFYLTNANTGEKLVDTSVTIKAFILNR